MYSRTLLTAFTFGLLFSLPARCAAQIEPAAGGSPQPAAAPIRMLTAADRSRTLFAAPGVALPKHSDEVFRAAYSPDGRWIAAVDVGMHLKISDAKTGALKHDVVIGPKKSDRFADRNLGLQFRPDGTLLAVTRPDRSGAGGNEVKLLDPATGIFVRTLTADKCRNFREPKFSRAGDRLVVLAHRDDERNSSTCAVVWTLADSRSQMIPLEGYAETYDLSPHDDTLAFVGENNSIGLYELATGKLKHTFVGPTSSRAMLERLRFHPDGSTLFADYNEIGLVAYDLHKKTRRFQVKDWHFGRMTFAPNGLLAMGGYRMSLHVMGEKGFHQVGDCSGDEINGGDDLSFSPDGKQLLVAGVEQSVLPHLLNLEWSLEKRKIPTAVEFIGGVAASRDGQWLAWLGLDSLTLYSLTEGAVKGTVKLDRPGERTLEFAADGKHLLAAMVGYQGTRVQEFTVPGLEPARNQTFEQSYLRGARYAPGGSDLLIFAREKLFAWKFGAPVPTESKLDFPPDKFQFIDGKQPRLFGIDDDTIYVYDDMNFTQPRSWPVGRPLDGFTVSPDGASVATFHSGQKRVAVWDVKTAQLQFEFEADSKGLEAVAFSGDGRWLLTSGEERGMRIWSGTTGKLRAVVAAHAGKIDGIQVVPGSSLFYTNPSGLFDDKAVRQWDLEQLLARLAEPVPPPPPPFTAGLPQYDLPSSNIPGIGFVEGGRVVYALDYMNVVRGYDAATKAELWQVKVGETNGVEVSADRRWLASAHGNEREFEMKLYELERSSGGRMRGEQSQLKPAPGHVNLWDIRTGKLHMTLPLETSTPLGLAFSPDGKTLAVASGTRGEMQFVIMGGGGDREEVKPVEQTTGPSPNSEISLWNVEAGTRTARLPVGRGQFTRVRFSGDGGLLAFSGSDDHVTVWNLKTNAVQYRLKLNLPFTDLQFSNDGRQLAVCSANRKRGRIDILDAATGTRQPKFDDFDAPTQTIAFSPQGDLFVAAARSGEKDFEYHFWNFADGPIKRVLRLPEAGYAAGTTNVVRFSPDGAKFVENGHGQVRVWRLDHLFDEPLQRSLQTLKERGLELSSAGDVVRIKFPHGAATDRELKDFPTLSQPFELDLASSEHVTDIGLVSLITRKNLVGLALNSCQNVGVAGLAGLKRLPLRTLDVRSTKLTTPEAYEMIGGFRSLENLKLDVGYTDDPDVLQPLSNLKDLRTLTFASANCPGTALFHISKLVKLEELRFEGAKIEDDNLRHFARMPKLRVLEIRSYEDKFTGAGLSHLAGCRELQTLKLGGPALSDAGFLALPPLTSLRTLDLSGTSLKGDGFKAVAGLTEIETLLLPGEITDAGLVHLGKLARLRELDLSRRSITDRGLAALTGLQSLEKLELANNEGVVGSGLAALAGSAKLTSLDLSYCTGLTDEGLSGVAKLSQLTRLSLPPQITDAGMKHLDALTSLWDLTIRKAKITDAGIAAIANLQNLKSLDLDGAMLTEAAIPHLHALSKLSSVNIGKSAFTKEAKDRLAKRSKDSSIYVRTGE